MAVENENQAKAASLESAFDSLFKTSVSSSGEEELLRIASAYSSQISSPQIKLLLYLEYRASRMSPANAHRLTTFISRWLELKKNNNSAPFVMRALESISLRKFINENTMKVNIDK